MNCSIIIAGSRACDKQEDFLLLVKRFGSIQEKENVIEIISGGAFGADKLGEKLAKRHSIPVKLFKPDWKKYGKAAGPIRNRKMAEYASNKNGVLIALWDDSSKGTKYMIKAARDYDLRTYIIIPPRFKEDKLF